MTIKKDLKDWDLDKMSLSQLQKLIVKVEMETKLQSQTHQEKIANMEAEYQKQKAENEKKFKESLLQFEKTETSIKELRSVVEKTETSINGLSFNVGKSIENDIQQGLNKTLNIDGIQYDLLISNLDIFDKKGQVITEIDFILMNGKYLAIIEVKHRINKTNIEHFMKVQLPKLKQQEKYFKDKQVLLYMGGASIDKKAISIAQSYGLGLLTADTQGITNVLAAQKNI